MHIFLNEASFHGQFAGQEPAARHNFHRAMARFLALVEAARAGVQQRGGCLWRSERLPTARAFEEETLHDSLCHPSAKEVRDSFLEIVNNRANPAPWEPERVHSPHVAYVIPADPPDDETDLSFIDGELMTETSVAELAERRLLDRALDGGLIGLDQSRYFSAAEVQVLKVEHARLTLRSWCRAADLDAWLRRDVREVPEYKDDAPDPPRDDQTCLVNRGVYEPTDRVCQGRRIYRHKTNGRYFYVDNLHSGAGAQLEVFDKYGKHLGVTSIRGGNPDKTKAVKGRIIDT